MRTLRNLSFLFLIGVFITTQAKGVRADPGCGSAAGQAGTTSDVSDDPGSWTCDNNMDALCESCMCDYGVDEQNSWCDWDEEVYYDADHDAYFVNDFEMWCACMPSELE